MRSEQEVLTVILSFAEQDERIRAVGMNGSRTNQNAPIDSFSDYDIVYVVTNLDSFIQNSKWIDVFGQRLIMQTPDEEERVRSRYAYLLLFTDGNRIDLTLLPVEECEAYAVEDSLTVILLDKDGIMPNIPAPSDRDYWVQQPSMEEYAHCCNEFWWVSTYVAKGIWRREWLYAYDYFHIVRRMYIQMLEWKVGITTGFTQSIGKNGKYLECYVSTETWRLVVEAHPGHDYETMWHALIEMTHHFEKMAVEVGESLQFQYNHVEANNVIQYVKEVRHAQRGGRNGDGLQ